MSDNNIILIIRYLAKTVKEVAAIPGLEKCNILKPQEGQNNL